MMSCLVQTKNKVSMDGIWPYDIEVSYANTGQKGDVTAGQVATLSLAHLDGIDIEQITVYVKSNKSSGAGEFTVTADGQMIASKSGTFREWTGSWDNTTYHPIALLQSSQKSVTELEITLTGTANSLHIERYEIQWTQAMPHTVTFMRGNRVYTTRTEPEGNGGIFLPSVPDSAEWKFRGWSETEFWGTATLPELYPANAKCYPMEDCTLWAVFEYQTEEETGYATDLTDGEYRYVNSANNKVLTGVPEDGKMQNGYLNISDEGQVYSIDFSDDGTATISHSLTGTPIGYSGTQMAVNNSPWKVYHEGEETIFYIESGAKKYVLWLNILAKEGTGETYAGLLAVEALSSPMRLMPVVEKEDEPYYTCHPEVPMGVEEVKDERTNELTGERVLMHLGNYRLKIKNGKKIIEL
jgi:hypothetical protein